MLAPQKPVYVDKVVEKVVEKPVEKVVYVDKVVEKPVEKIVEKRVEVKVRETAPCGGREARREGEWLPTAGWLHGRLHMMVAELAAPVTGS